MKSPHLIAFPPRRQNKKKVLENGNEDKRRSHLFTSATIAYNKLRVQIPQPPPYTPLESHSLPHS
ncbi:hypothetical protein LC653_43950 [Nostoc sp. CHAB 5784]|nr:hypothetical protein [Nostoc mirabile CHAB5784]